MDKASYILNNIYHLHALAGRILDETGNLKATSFEGFSECDPVLTNPKLRKELMEMGRNGVQGKYRIWDDSGYRYYVIYASGIYVVWGPVLFEEYSEYEQYLYGKKRNEIKGKFCAISIADIKKLEKTVAFAHGLLFEEYGRIAVVERGEEEERVQEELLTKYSEYRLQNAEWDREHYSFTQEHQMWKWLVGGNLSIEERYAFPKEVDNLVEEVTKGIGVMSESLKKNTEYAVVSTITLLTRYAIASGMNDSDAYALSDAALQKLSKAMEVVEMESILDSTFREFMRFGREAAEKLKSQSFYVEQTRNYIAKHIYEKLSLSEIAGEIGLHPAYLSRIFTSQTGMPLMEYVMQEKVKVSCNLLKYSNRPIAIIAEYVSLAPQSYFTKVFKKVMGETPAKYRKSHFDKNFIES